MIHAGKNIMEVVGGDVLAEVVVLPVDGGGRIRVWQWVGIRQGLADRIDSAGGDLVAWERSAGPGAIHILASCRIVDRNERATAAEGLRKVACALQCGWHGGAGYEVGSLLVAFPTIEKEGLVLAVVQARDANRTAHGVAVFIERLGALDDTGGIVGPGVGEQRCALN